MTNSIDFIVKLRIQMRPKFISPESAKTIACADQKKSKIGQKKVPKIFQIKKWSPRHFGISVKGSFQWSGSGTLGWICLRRDRALIHGRSSIPTHKSPPPYRRGDQSWVSKDHGWRVRVFLYVGQWRECLIIPDFHKTKQLSKPKEKPNQSHIRDHNQLAHKEFDNLRKLLTILFTSKERIEEWAS